MIRVSPPELALEFAGPCCSTSVTFQPLWRKTCAIHAPKTPAPTTVAEPEDMFRKNTRCVVEPLCRCGAPSATCQETGPKVAVLPAVWLTRRKQLRPQRRLS